MQRIPLTEVDRPQLAQYGLLDAELSGLAYFDYEKGEYLCRVGEALPYLMLITSGRAKITYTASNGRTLLYCFDDGKGSIGSIELLAGSPATATAQAVTPMRCIAIPVESHLTFLKNSVGFLNYLCLELSLAFEKSSRKSAVNLLYPLRTRLCAYIAMMHEGGVFRETLVEVSEHLGVSYRHLLRSLDALCGQGVLRKEKGGYVVTNQTLLEELAEDYYSL